MAEFAVWAPQRDRVRVLTDGTTHAMTRDDAGWWRADVSDAGPGTAYAFLLDDDPTPLPDPRSLRQPTGVHGAVPGLRPRRLHLDRPAPGPAGSCPAA